MSYSYEKERLRLLTDDGQRAFLKWRDAANNLLKVAGAFRHESVKASVPDSFFGCACADRMLELGELYELTPPKGCWGQDRVFTKEKPRGMASQPSAGAADTRVLA